MKMGKHRKKKVSFGRIWIAIALPVTALRLKERDLSSPKGCSDILNLEKSQMVAVLYDEQGNRLGESDISGYDNRRHIGKKLQHSFKPAERNPDDRPSGESGVEGVDLFGVSL